MNTPPTPEQLRDADGGGDRGCDDEDDENFDSSLQNDFYKNGVRPAYLQVNNQILF